MRFSLQQIFNIHDAVWCGPILRKDLKLGYVDADQLKNMYPPCDFILAYSMVGLGHRIRIKQRGRWMSMGWVEF